MSIDEGEGLGLELETLHGRSWPTVTQFSVFLENRVGQLREVVRAFQGSKVRIVGLSIADSSDCCIVRVLLSHSEQGRLILDEAELHYAMNELLVCGLPGGPGALGEMCGALLQAEINIYYAYPLLVHPLGLCAVALHVDNIEQAAATLHDKGFEVVSEADLQA